jgi:hypothetical protein
MAVIDLKVNIPQSLSAIKLHQYQKYLEVSKNVDSESDDNEFLNLKALDIFCGLNLKESYNLPLSMFESILDKLSECFNEKTEFIQRFSMVGSDGVEVEFGFIPNLEKISFGEYVDLESYISDWKNMHKAMAVMYRPIVAGKKQLYEIEPYQGSDRWSEVMKDAPVNVALGAIVFFYRLGKKLSKYTMNYLLEDRMSQEDTQQHLDSAKSGDGISQYMVLLEVMYEELMRLPKFPYTPA